MPWTVNDSRATFYNISKACQSKYDEWKEKITGGEKGMEPKSATEAIGYDMNYELLQGKKGDEYTIRLSREHRVAFTIDKANQVVNVFQVGGHYPKAKK